MERAEQGSTSWIQKSPFIFGLALLVDPCFWENFQRYLHRNVWPRKVWLSGPPQELRTWASGPTKFARWQYDLRTYGVHLLKHTERIKGKVHEPLNIIFIDTGYIAYPAPYDNERVDRELETYLVQIE